jgi:hypothetical protein
MASGATVGISIRTADDFRMVGGAIGKKIQLPLVATLRKDASF